MKYTVAVTGSSGFLGSHLLPMLRQQGFEVIAISRGNGFDICNPASLQNLPPFNAIVHLAAKTFVPDSYNHTAEFLSSNINGTLHALELCKKNKARFVYASSYVYGPPAYLPVDENHPVNLWNPYAAGKIIGEQLCQTYSKEFKLPVDILRIFNIYGPGQNPTFVIPKIINGVMEGRLDLETGTPKRDFVYVADVCKAILSCLNVEPGNVLANIYNVGTGDSHSVNQLVELAKKLCGKMAEVTFNAGTRPVEVPDVRANFAKIKVDRNWQPSVSLEEGMQRIIDSLHK